MGQSYMTLRATRKASSLKLVFQRLNVVSRREHLKQIYNFKTKAEPRSANMWSVLAEDITKHAVLELTHTQHAHADTHSPEANRRTDVGQSCVSEDD